MTLYVVLAEAAVGWFPCALSSTLKPDRVLLVHDGQVPKFTGFMTRAEVRAAIRRTQRYAERNGLAWSRRKYKIAKVEGTTA